MIDTPPPISLLRYRGLPIYEQLRMEEALLRADDRNWCLINVGTDPAIVMGISGKPDLLIDGAVLARQPVPVIKRFSGGGTVFVDANTVFVTWICNVAHVNVPCCPQKVHQWTASFYQSALPTLGMTLRENDYVVGERKWGGNAQYLSRGRWLHHTSMLWDYDPESMRYLLMPSKIPAYRGQRNHSDFLCRLCDYLPNTQVFEDSIIGHLEKRFDVISVPHDEVCSIMNLPHRASTHYLTAS